MEIPSDVQARINSIVSRFNPTPPAAPVSSTTTRTPTTTATGGDFASVLAETLAAADARTSTYPMTARVTSGIASAASVTALTAGWQNGRLPDTVLAPIGSGGHRLAAPAATAFRQLRAAAAMDGVTIGVTDSYRTYDEQVDLARRKGLYSQGGLAARPGTSDHGLGLALDLDLDDTAQAWMRTNGARFGFVEDTPREPWHWKFDGV